MLVPSVCRFNTGEERYVFLSCLATLLGAWLGAFPILLDWNRVWQEWPIPCSVGAVLGHTAGVLGYLLLHVSDYNNYCTIKINI